MKTLYSFSHFKSLFFLSIFSFFLLSCNLSLRLQEDSFRLEEPQIFLSKLNHFVSFSEDVQVQITDYIRMQPIQPQPITMKVKSYCEHGGVNSEKTDIIFNLKEIIYFYELLPYEVLTQPQLEEAHCIFHFEAINSIQSIHTFSLPSLHIIIDESIRNDDILSAENFLNYSFEDSSSEKRLQCQTFFLTIPSSSTSVENLNLDGDSSFFPFHLKYEEGALLTDPMPPSQICRIFYHSHNMISNVSNFFQIPTQFLLLELLIPSHHDEKGISYIRKNISYTQGAEEERNILIHEEINSSSLLNFSWMWKGEEPLDMSLKINGDCKFSSSSNSMDQNEEDLILQAENHFFLRREESDAIPIYDLLPVQAFLHMGENTACNFNFVVLSSNSGLESLGQFRPHHEFKMVFEKIHIELLTLNTGSSSNLSHSHFKINENQIHTLYTFSPPLEREQVQGEVNHSEINLLTVPLISNFSNTDERRILFENELSYFEALQSAVEWNLKCEDFDIENVETIETQSEIRGVQFDINFFRNEKFLNNFFHKANRKSIQNCFLYKKTNQGFLRAFSIFTLEFPELKRHIDFSYLPRYVDPLVSLNRNHEKNCHYEYDTAYEASFRSVPDSNDLFIVGEINIKNPYQKPLFFSFPTRTYKGEIQLYYLKWVNNNLLEFLSLDLRLRKDFYIQFYKLYHLNESGKGSSLNEASDKFTLPAGKEMSFLIHTNKRVHPPPQDRSVQYASRYDSSVQYSFHSDLKILQLYDDEEGNNIAYTHDITHQNETFKLTGCPSIELYRNENRRSRL